MDTKPTPSKFIQFNLNTAAIADLTTEFLKPGKLTTFLQGHISGIFISTLWLALHLRSWLSALPPLIPSLSTLPLILLALVSFSLTTPDRILFGLAYHSYTEICSFITSLIHKILPTWLPRAIPIVLLFRITDAATLLFVLAVWEIVRKYRNGIACATEKADKETHRAVSAAEKAGGYVREARNLEMQAMQLAAAVVDDKDETSKATVATVRDVKTEVEGMVMEVGVLGLKVDKVRELAGRAKVVAEEGDFELAGKMIANVGKLVEMVVQGEEKAREKVEEAKGRLWKLSLGKGSG